MFVVGIGLMFGLLIGDSRGANGDCRHGGRRGRGGVLGLMAQVERSREVVGSALVYSVLLGFMSEVWVGVAFFAGAILNPLEVTASDAGETLEQRGEVGAPIVVGERVYLVDDDDA